MRKILLVLALILLPVSAHPVPAVPLETGANQKSVLMENLEARLEQQKSKWAPNGMKVLIIQGKRRFVKKNNWRPVEKRLIIPIQKEGV